MVATQSTTSSLAPPLNFVKVNGDVDVAKHGNIGVVAVVCRDANGLFLGASALDVPRISHPATLEAIACREGSFANNSVQVHVWVSFFSMIHL
jgi:hypothetical protein